MKVKIAAKFFVPISFNDRIRFIIAWFRYFDLRFFVGFWSEGISKYFTHFKNLRSILFASGNFEPFSKKTNSHFIFFTIARNGFDLKLLHAWLTWHSMYMIKVICIYIIKNYDVNDLKSLIQRYLVVFNKWWMASVMLDIDLLQCFRQWKLLALIHCWKFSLPDQSVENSI